MKLRDLMDQVKDLPADTLVCAAEIDEAFATNIAGMETVERARIESRKPDGTEAVELVNGSDQGSGERLSHAGTVICLIAER